MQIKKIALAIALTLVGSTVAIDYSYAEENGNQVKTERPLSVDLMDQFSIEFIDPVIADTSQPEEELVAIGSETIVTEESDAKLEDNKQTASNKTDDKPVEQVASVDSSNQNDKPTPENSTDVVAKNDKSTEEKAVSDIASANTKPTESTVSVTETSSSSAIASSSTDSVSTSVPAKEEAKDDTSVAKNEPENPAEVIAKNDADNKQGNSIDKVADATQETTTTTASTETATTTSIADVALAQNTETPKSDVKEDASKTEATSKDNSKDVKEPFVITGEMLYSQEMEEKFPLPKPFDEFHPIDVNMTDMNASAGIYHVERGIGTQKMVHDIYNDNYRNAGVTPYQLLVSVYRRNPKQFGITIPLYPYANADLVIPTVEQASLESRDTYMNLFTTEGAKISPTMLPPLAKTLEEQQQEYDTLLRAYEERRKVVLEQRKNWLNKKYNNK